MRIGFVYERFDARVGSFGAHGYFLASELVRRGHELWGPGLPDMPGMVSVADGKWGKLRMLRNADILYIRPNVLHWAERCTWLRLLKPSCPVVWEINGVAEEIRGSNTPREQAERRLARDLRCKRRMSRLVDAAVCVTESLADYARQRYGIRRCVVAPNGGDLAAYMPEGGGTVLGDMKDRFIVLWAGSAEQPWQGLSQIVDAARLCERSAPDVLFALLLGGRQGASRLPVYRNMLLLAGTDRPTVNRYMADADCSLVLYRRCDDLWRSQQCGSSDAFSTRSPLKLFDAMAARKAVIATAVGQSAAVVRDGVDGLLVSESPEALVKAILRLRDDPQLRERLASSARQRIESGYTWRHTVDRIEPLLLELAVGHRVARTPASMSSQAAIEAVRPCDVGVNL